MSHQSNLVLDDILRYIPKFQNEIFVVFISGSVLKHGNIADLSRQWAILHSLGIKLILVHGSRLQISELIAKDEIHFIHNESIRVTTPELLQTATRTSLDLSYLILRSLANTALTGFSIQPIIGHFIKAKPMGIIDGIDYLLTGQVDKIEKNKILSLLDSGFLPIIPPLGIDAEGQHYNLRAAEVAAQIASKLNTKKLIYIIEDDYLWISDQMGAMTLENLETKINELDKQGKLDSLLAERLNSASWACRHNVERIHFINGIKENSLLKEIFTQTGQGLLITGESYSNIRSAQLHDIAQMLQIFNQSSQLGELRSRDRQEIINKLQDYIVFEIDQKLTAVVAFHKINEKCYQIAALAVDPHYRHLGIGKKLITFLIKKAQKQKIAQIYAFSTRATQFFRQLQFKEISPEQLSEDLQGQWQRDRKSKIFFYKV